MASPRALANHSLYLGKVVTHAWQQQLAQQQIPAAVLAEAFAAPAARHLVAAYGWFLLTLAHLGELPASPPASVSELPPVAAGKALTPELAEFARLESSDWLAQLQALARGESGSSGPLVPRSTSNLAVPSAVVAAPKDLLHWAEQLTALFSRMGDSLDEY